MNLNQLLTANAGESLFLLGNEAIVRGALEGGVGVVTTYPGTPASEIGDTFHALRGGSGIYFEYSVNEMVAMQIAASAAQAGQRAMAVMKHVGLNVAADAWMTLSYTGVRGGFVLVCADDPGAHSSQNEQDNRYYAQMAGVPMLQPATPQECLNMTREAFALSEALELPVMLRTTTRVAHVRAGVELGQRQPPRADVKFEKDPFRFVAVPMVARQRHKVLLEKQHEARALANDSEFNIWTPAEGAELTVVSEGVNRAYVKEALARLEVPANVLELGFYHPLPEALLLQALRAGPPVVVVEELEPFIENGLRGIAQRNGLTVIIGGKYEEYFPRMLEFTPDIIENGLRKALGREPLPAPLEPGLEVPARPPVLCAGCPHRTTYVDVKQATRRERDTIFPNDIGCYALGFAPPLGVADTLTCMGAAVGAGEGFSVATDQPVVSFVGDSTLFHSALPGIVNALHHNHNLTLMVLDNSTTGMTGHQPHPGLDVEGTRIDMEAMLRGMGVGFLRVVDPIDMELMRETIREAQAYQGFAVIISRAPCVLLASRGGDAGPVHYVEQDLCIDCHRCINELGCPAIYLAEGKVLIDAEQCVGCTLCAQICPTNAILEVAQ